MTSIELALNKLCKWRMIFAGWQLGTRSKDDPECQAVRDHREVTILLRAEVNALIEILVHQGIILQDQWIRSLETEAKLLDKDYERKFPGATTSQDGVTLTKPAIEWMKNFRS